MLFCINSQSVVLVIGVSSCWSFSLPQEETFCRRCSQALRSAGLSHAVGVLPRICSAVSCTRNLSMRERGLLLPSRGAVPARHGAPAGSAQASGHQPPSFTFWDAGVRLLGSIPSIPTFPSLAELHACLQHPNMHENRTSAHTPLKHLYEVWAQVSLHPGA